MFKNLFSNNTDRKRRVKELEETNRKLSDAVDQNMKVVEDDINTTRQFFEKMRNHGIRRFDSLLNVSLQSSITNADLILLTEKIRVSKRRFEKLLFARMLAMIVLEYLRDINTYLGHNLIAELNSNNYKPLVSTIKDINKQFAEIRKKHEKLLTTIRNNISAHKTKDSLDMVHHIFSLDPEEIYTLSIEVIKTNTKLSDAITEIYYKMIDEANAREKNSR